uniref:somatostatin receptor type 2-like isoform X2 n=1 Tax=Styela clava TaxID=7725 RepID=UPI0019394AEB|nr:somatostatin receptor type 2-like isoform X2 [Styela clava]
MSGSSIENDAGNDFYVHDQEHDGSSDYDYYDNRAFQRETFEYDSGYGQAITMGIISIVGLIFNAIVILVICALQDYKKTSHWYVLNLAIADSMFLLMLPLDMASVLTKKWSFGLPLCIAYNVAFYVNYYAGIFFLMVMSIDRYAAIIHPMSCRWRKLRSGKVCWFLTISVWVLSVLVALPILIRLKIVEESCVPDFYTGTKEDKCVAVNWKLEHCDSFHEIKNGPHHYLDKMLDEMTRIKDGNTCYHDAPYPYFTNWIYCNVFLTFFAPIAIMVACYGCILWRVLHPRISSTDFVSTRVSAKSFLRRNSSSKMNSIKRRTNIRVTVLVVSLVATFIACWAPFNVNLVAKIGGMSYITRRQCEILDVVVNLIAYSNSLWNPVLYTFLGANFHKRVGRVWKSIQARNAATKEIFASFKKTKRGNYTGSRCSAASKITKTTDSVVSGATSNINVHVLSAPCKDDNRYSTTGLKT